MAQSIRDALGIKSPSRIFRAIGQFITEEGIRLIPVETGSMHEVKESLEFFMGKNTPERQVFIIDNLIIEQDILEEKELIIKD
jgi:hypothetical protein